VANTTVSIYIRNKSGLRKPGKPLGDLTHAETYMLYWYEGTKRKAKAVGRFADEAAVSQIDQEAELKRRAVGRPVAEPVAVLEPELSNPLKGSLLAAVELYLSEVKRGKSKKTYMAYRVTLLKFFSV
jgi:hypothetical protein